MLGVVLLAWLALTVTLQLIARPRDMEMKLQKEEGKQLIVVVHGLGGRATFQPMFDLVHQTFPKADVLDVEYDSSPFSNASAYEISDRIEDEIDNLTRAARYDSIVLVGHSMGANILRKVLIWGHGHNEDRPHPLSKHAWVDHVDRFVSLAGINRAGRSEPRRRNMDLDRYLLIWVGERVARLTGTGKLILSLRRGSPFIADSRVQSIFLTLRRVARWL